MAILALAMTAAMVATAQAQSYGELLRFGKPGKGKGQFTNSFAVHALGVDPTDNSVYVGDESESGFRIQKLSSTGGFIAQVKLKFANSARAVGLEGIAVDPSLERVYALVVYERKEEEEGGLLDPEYPSAGILYAFSTKPTGEELVPAAGAPEGVLASTSVLHAQAEVTAKPTESALLEPAGIAVDPTTKDVVILGAEDQGEERLVSAAQRVHSNGTLGGRWVDTTNCFENEGSEACEERAGGAPVTSPVVTQTGRVLVALSESEIAEIPQSFAPGTLPQQVLVNDPLQAILEFPGNPQPSEGGAMTYVHDSTEGPTEGKLYVAGEVKTTLGKFPGMLAYEVTDGGAPPIKELGWTGGQSKAEQQACAISSLSQPVVAAGSKEAVFVFDPDRPTIAEEQKGATVNPHVVVFGPNGSGCPTPSAEKPKVSLNGTEIPEKSPVPAGQKVTLSSNLTNANALSVEWSFGDGTAPETVSKYQFQSSRVEHAFKGVGTFTVKETIHVDNLALPTIMQETKVLVEAAKPTAQFSGPSKVTVGQSALFDGKGSSDPNGSTITKYAWKFGDGGEATTTTPTTSHIYGSAGVFTVSLQVTDGLSLTSTVVSHVTTASDAGGGGGGGETPGGGEIPGGEIPGGGSTTGGGTTTGGGSGVLGTQVKAVPDARLASTSLTVSSSGGVPVKVSCPAGESSCAGTITLRTLGAVSAQVTSGKKTVLTLATGSFAVAGGSSKSLMLHLSAKARKLLAKSHVLKARATIQARGAAGASHTTLSTVTLKLAKKSAHH